jgi:hypothetical protein
MVRMAEAAVADLTDELWRLVLSIAEKGPIVRPRAEQAETHFKNLKVGIPSAHIACVGDIINAGWQRYDEIIDGGKDVFEQLAQLNEILLKTIEVFEYQRRIN